MCAAPGQEFRKRRIDLVNDREQTRIGWHSALALRIRFEFSDAL